MLRKASLTYHLTDKNSVESSGYVMVSSLEPNIQMLLKKFKDFENIFNYYLGSTREFFSLNPSNLLYS